MIEALLILGTIMAALAVVCMLRFERPLAKIHAAATAAFGVLVALAGCALTGGALGVRALLVAVLLIPTAAVSVHVLARLELLLTDDRCRGEPEA